VHQRRLAGAVRPDQARDARRDVQRDAVHAQHVAVELRDVFEEHCRFGHRTTSTGRSLCSITTMSSRTNPVSASIDVPAPGPSGGVTPSSTHHTRLTAQAGSRTCPHVTRKTWSIIADTPARMKKTASV